MRPQKQHRSNKGTCGACGKQSFGSRKEARLAARQSHPGDQMSAYECRERPGSGVWHYGHSHLWRVPPKQVETPGCPATARAGIAAVAAATMRAAAG